MNHLKMFINNYLLAYKDLKSSVLMIYYDTLLIGNNLILNAPFLSISYYNSSLEAQLVLLEHSYTCIFKNSNSKSRILI